MIVYPTFQYLRGRPVQLTETILRGPQRVLPAALTLILMLIVEVLGMLLLVIPGFIAAASLVVAIPACVVERLDAMASLSRSLVLTKGYRWSIFGIFISLARRGTRIRHRGMDHVQASHRAWGLHPRVFGHDGNDLEQNPRPVELQLRGNGQKRPAFREAH
jgi:hypothetical protein